MEVNVAEQQTALPSLHADMTEHNIRPYTPLPALLTAAAAAASSVLAAASSVRAAASATVELWKRRAAPVGLLGFTLGISSLATPCLAVSGLLNLHM